MWTYRIASITIYPERIMEDRYELRGKIGQGGIGSVHRAYDHKMKREVAIKRILTSSEDPHLQEEATKQLLQEVSALASLQHPHIVTVYDVGSDEAGPYIVMELIHGKTLDEIAEHAPLVWHDFKIVAMQTLEALIAAQELDMIHSDLKPPNIMLTWLPSGAFQVKIVDFGLAVLIQSQSQEEIEKMEAVYGSIFFMPPEQYERKTLDTRSDLYSLGCCFYQALSGVYPFSGSTGMEVMQAHLNHTVTPIQEIRGDIPLWACNWLMWLINRYPDDRPPSAREALANFLQNDKETSPIMSRGGSSGKHPRFIIPGPSTATGSIPTLRQTAIVSTVAAHTAGDNPAATAPEESEAHKKRKLPKHAIKIAIAAMAVLLLVGAGWFVMHKYDGMQQKQAYDRIATMATREDVKEVQITQSQLQVVLDVIRQAKPDAYLVPGYAVLAKAKAADSADFDTIIGDFVTTAQVPTGIRQNLFQQVIGKRAGSALVPGMLKFSAGAKDPKEASAAFDAIRGKIREEHAAALIHIIVTSDHPNLRQDAEAEMAMIIGRSQDRKDLSALLSSANTDAAKPSSRQVLDRLLALCNPKPQAQAQPQPKPAPPKPQPTAQPQPAQQLLPKYSAEVTKLMELFESSDDAGKAEAITAISKLPDVSGHVALVTIAQSSDAQLKSKAVEGLIHLNSLPPMIGNANDARPRWLQIIWRTDSPDQKILVIQALAKIRADWSTVLIEEMSRGAENPATILARQTLENIKKGGTN